ncbi:MAG: molecular chaperone DnaK [Pseudanabaena sp.]|nr:MAG: molecular chaperone DnaK [Pseudanabaena sp.]
MTIISIDFGTSNTAIAILDREGDVPKTWRFEHISHCFKTTKGEAWLVPSLVYVAKSQEKFLFGEEARTRYLLQEQPLTKSERLFQGFKRDIVANFRPPAREIDGERYDAEAIAEVFLAELWHRLELQTDSQNIELTQLVLTAPVGAFESYLNWFESLAEKLKLPNFQVIDESTAAALGYAITRPNALVLVIDFGGGTLDLSLVRTAPIANDLRNRKITKAEAIAKSDAYIGGIDIDRWIAEYFLRQLQQSRSQIDQASWLRLLEVSEQIKIKLSLVSEVSEPWRDQKNIIHNLQFTQIQLSELLEQHQMINQLRDAIDEVLATGLQRGISKAAIEQVLLVGGSCQIVAVQQLIMAYFGKSKVSFDKPFEAVAHGALALGQTIAVEDYLRHSYAVKLWEPYLHQYSYYTLFEKGTKYPCKRAEPLILQAAIANQEEIWINIGEVADISQAEVSYDSNGKITSSQLLKQSDFRSLAVNEIKQANRLDNESSNDQICMARLNPLGQLGVDRLRIDFEVNDRRVLIATVFDLLSDRLLIDHQAIVKLE